MIKNKLVLLLLLFAICLFSCREDAPSQALLDQAEAWMNEHPDSALWLLENDILPERLSARQQADWALFLTQARDKNYQTHANDSLIRLAVDYYEKQINPERLMTAYYYRGRIFQDTGDALQAQECFLQALSCGEKADNIPMKARIYANLGALYLHQDAHREAMPYLQQAQYCFIHSKDSANLAITLRDIARIHVLENQPDSVYFYYTQALTYANVYEKPFILNELGGFYARENDCKTANTLIEEALSFSDGSEAFAPVYLSKAHLLIESGEKDSVVFYLTKSLQTSNRYTAVSAYQTLYQLAKEEKDWEKYAYYQELYEKEHDILLKELHAQEIHKIQSLYTYQVDENEVNTLKLARATSQRNLLLLTLFVFLLLAVIGGSIAYFLYRRRKTKEEREKRLLAFREKKFTLSAEQLEQNREQITNLKQHLSDSAFEENRNQIEIDLLECMNQVIMQFMNERDMVEVKMKNSPVYKKLCKEATHLTPELYEEIHALMQSLYPQLIPHIQERLDKKITTAQMELIYLLKMGITPTKIAGLLSVGNNAISNRQTRLAQKILGKEAKTEQLVDYIQKI